MGDGADLREVSEARRQDYPPKGKPGRQMEVVVIFAKFPRSPPSDFLHCFVVDIFSLQKLMGRADLQVLRRYLAQTTEDIAQAH